MGLFSFVGKALKGISKVASFVPGVGGIVGKVAGIAGGLLDSKQPMSTTAAKMRQASVLRGGSQSLLLRAKSPMSGGLMNASVLRSTPIMPGGAVSTPQGIMASGGGYLPLQFGGSGSGSGRRRARARPKAKKRRKAKLKFGSPAWRKKYMPKRRKRAA